MSIRLSRGLFAVLHQHDRDVDIYSGPELLHGQFRVTLTPEDVNTIVEVMGREVIK